MRIPKFFKWMSERYSPSNNGPTSNGSMLNKEDLNGSTGANSSLSENQDRFSSSNGPPPISMMTLDDHHLFNNGTNGSMVHNGSLMTENQTFNRHNSNRMSLPIMQHNKLRRQAYSQLQRRGQQPPRSLGHIYLQHKGETKQASLPNELTTIDTIRALFVCAFPRMLSMEYMSQPHVKIYIYNPSCNIFYELMDIEEVKHESVLRIHHSEPLVPMIPPPQQAMQQMAPSHYATIHRLPTRVGPQQLPPPPPMPPHMMIPSVPQMQPQMSTPQLSQFNQQQLPIPQMGQRLTPSGIPPPKPRRMIPSNYAMHHRLTPQ